MVTQNDSPKYSNLSKTCNTAGLLKVSLLPFVLLRTYVKYISIAFLQVEEDQEAEEID